VGSVVALKGDRAMSGLQLLEAVRDGHVARPGVGVLLDLRFPEIEEGRVVVEIDARPEFGNPLGTVHGGITATILDTAMGCAVHSTLPAVDSYTTVDLAVTYLRGVPYDGRLLRAEGRVVHLGGRLATAEGRVVDGEGRLIATATTTCMVFRDGRK
jgi:uncharacterized protein (TIGR00369 family)